RGDGRAAGDGADAERENAGVGGFDDDVLDSDAQDIRANLREYRGVTLPLAGRPGLDDDFSGRLDPDAGALERREAGVFDIARDAAADVAAPLARRRTPRFEVVARAVQNRIQAGVIVTAIVADQ